MTNDELKYIAMTLLDVKHVRYGVGIRYTAQTHFSKYPILEFLIFEVKFEMLLIIRLFIRWRQILLFRVPSTTDETYCVEKCNWFAGTLVFDHLTGVFHHSQSSTW